MQWSLRKKNQVEHEARASLMETIPFSLPWLVFDAVVP